LTYGVEALGVEHSKCCIVSCHERC
jgi:hypothetical protein